MIMGKVEGNTHRFWSYFALMLGRAFLVFLHCKMYLMIQFDYILLNCAEPISCLLFLVSSLLCPKGLSATSVH